MPEECSDWPGVSHMPTPGAIGAVSTTQTRWTENKVGVAPQGRLWGRGNRDWAGLNARWV